MARSTVTGTGKLTTSSAMMFVISLTVLGVVLHTCHGHSHSGHNSVENPQLKLMAAKTRAGRLKRDVRSEVKDAVDYSGEPDPDQFNPHPSMGGQDQKVENQTVSQSSEDFQFEEEAGVTVTDRYEVTSPSVTNSMLELPASSQHHDHSHEHADSSQLLDDTEQHSHGNHSDHHIGDTHHHSEHNNGATTSDGLGSASDIFGSLPPESRLVLQKLFQKYGDGNMISFEGFEHLLDSIGLGNIAINDHDVGDHRQMPGSFVNLHEGHEHSVEVRDTSRVDDGEATIAMETIATTRQERMRNRKQNSKEKSRRQKPTEAPESSSSEEDDLNLQEERRRRRHAENKDTARDSREVEMCMPSVHLYNAHSHHGNPNSTLTPEDFLALCPLLIYQLDTHSCHHSNKDLDEEQLEKHYRKYHGNQPEYQSHGDDDDGEDYGIDVDDLEKSSSSEESGYNSPSVWGYALLSCFIISVVGLASVAVVPIMHKVVYNHLLQFLVALAIGSLTGDAFLHLLPHAIKPHSHSESSSRGSHEHGSHGYDSNEYIPGEGEVDLGEEIDKSAVWVGLVALSGVYFFFLMERVMGIITSRRRDKHQEKRKRRGGKGRRYSIEMESQIGAKLSGHQDMTKSCQDALMVVHSNKDVRHMAVDAHNELHQNCDPGVRDSWVPGHSHGDSGGHHHSHEVPGSVSSVAWMVIMGDGLHNFSDGLAIGAAFANGLTSGLSTSIAVFCHELPHELGDFAVLLRAGMSVKQALVYNCVSSVLCLIGMVIGIVVGNLASASTWIFAVIAGMFVYIALVDMLPELTRVTPKEGENPCLHLVLQCVGMLAGAAIMLIIAVYEERIKIPHFET